MRRLAVLLACLCLAACAAGVPAPSPGGAAASSGAAASAGAPASTCGLSGPSLGTPIDSAAGYTVHDTAPGTTAPRVHHVTGFADGCARSLTAALVVFGDVASYETVRAAAPTGGRSPTDAAFDAIAARVCGSAPGQPCGAALDRLARDTVFLSAYPVFGAEEHTDLLLHAGEVAAVEP